MHNLKVGFAKQDITPPVGTELCGYGYYLERRNTGVADPVYARSIAFLEGSRRYLIVNCDLTGVDGNHNNLIKAEISKRLNLSEDDMLLACIHTHTAPALANLVGCGELDPTYAAWAVQKIVNCACEAFDALQPVAEAKVSSCDNIEFGIDRRGSGARICRTMYALTFTFENRRPLVLLNYGCHPVAFDLQDKVSADYPGAAVAAMDELGCDAVFLNAFCGDVNPAEKRDYESVLKGRQFATYYEASMANAEVLEDLTLQSASFDEYLDLQFLPQETIDKEVAYMLRVSNNSKAFQKVTGIWEKVNVARRNGMLPAQDLLHVRFFAIGKVLFAGFSAEMASELRYIISEDHFSDYIVFPIGNLFDTRRYLATIPLFDRNTYETINSTFAYGTSPIVKGEAERAVTSACKRAKRELH